MKTVGIRDLKNKLSAYISLAKSGEGIVVTERGKPVAILKPINKADLEEEATVEERIAALAKEGLIRLPLQCGISPFEPVRVKGSLVSSAILEDRR